jgi:hypothetical protein
MDGRESLVAGGDGTRARGCSARSVAILSDHGGLCLLLRPRHQPFGPVEMFGQHHQSRDQEDPARHNRQNQSNYPDRHQREAAADPEQTHASILERREN